MAFIFYENRFKPYFNNYVTYPESPRRYSVIVLLKKRFEVFFFFFKIKKLFILLVIFLLLFVFYARLRMSCVHDMGSISSTEKKKKKVSRSMFIEAYPIMLKIGSWQTGVANLWHACRRRHDEQILKARKNIYILSVCFAFNEKYNFVLRLILLKS